MPAKHSSGTIYKSAFAFHHCCYPSARITTKIITEKRSVSQPGNKLKNAGFLSSLRHGVRSVKMKFRGLHMLLGALLIISGRENIKVGLEELESMLITYQQVNLKGSTDSIFLCLMVGYFAESDYQKCAQTFKRYNKIIKGKPVFEGNDTKIHAYYYLSQWLNTRSRQYPIKFEALFDHQPEENIPRTILELARYFQLPVKFKS